MQTIPFHSDTITRSGDSGGKCATAKGSRSTTMRSFLTHRVTRRRRLHMVLWEMSAESSRDATDSSTASSSDLGTGHFWPIASASDRNSICIDSV